jgi:hypothetical protein
MVFHKSNISTHSKLKLRTIFVLPVTLVIATVILSSGFSHSIFAFSNKYSNQERYDSGVRDGNKACNQGLDATAISNYQQSSTYLGHSKYYQQGYDDTVNNCSISDNGSGSGNQPSQSPNSDTPQQTPDNSNPPDNSQQTPGSDTFGKQLLCWSAGGLLMLGGVPAPAVIAAGQTAHAAGVCP